MKNPILAFTALLCVNSALYADLKQELIEAHGFQNFDQIEEIQFAFKARIAIIHKNRYWKWNTKTNVVTLLDKDGEIEFQYDRDDLSTLGKEAEETEKNFINDTFWLAWPLHLSWNNDVQVIDQGVKECPLTDLQRRCIVIDYSSTEGGFTPGDRYELFFDEGDLKPESWAYYPAGDDDPKVVCSWEDYTTIEGFSFSQTHENSNGLFKLNLEEIQIKLVE
ncbi:MAG: hypothetical protein ACFCU1_08185 [Sumerlaeia bacterium]